MIGLELHVFARGEMFRDVGARPEDPLLFAAPEREAYRAIEPKVQRFQDAHHLDHDGAARRVIGRARATVPAVEMRADHHDLIALASARNLSDDVHRVHPVVEEARLNVELKLHGNLAIEQARDAVVMLRRQHHHRRWNRILRIARAAGLREDGAPFTAAAAGAHRDRDALVREEFIERALELCASAKGSALPARPADRVGARRPLTPAALTGIRRLCDRRKLRIRSPQPERLQAHLQLASGAEQHHLPFEHPFVLVEVRFVVDRDDHRVAADGAVGARRIGERRADERRGLGLGHVRREARVRPAAPERAPFFLVCADAPVTQPLDDPVGRAEEAGRVREPRAAHIGQVKEVLHHL